MADTENSTPRAGDEVEVTIRSIAFGGDGVARHGNYVLFVPDVIPGETIIARISEVKRSYGRALPVKILHASPDRVEPACDVYGLCGGCQYQHVAYGRSLELKQRQVKEVMLRIGGLEIEGDFDTMRAAPDAYAYRNAISLHLRESEGTRRAGYFARDNRTFVPISHCPIASNEINEALPGIEAVVEGFEHPESIKSLIIKNAGDRRLVHPVYRKPIRFMPDERLSYRYKHINFHYGPKSFFQVNHTMIPVLIELARDGLAPDPGQMLLDLYAGVGLFSLALADKYGQVVGIEAGEEAVACFETNVAENGIGNVTVVRGRVEENLKAVHRETEGGAVSVLVDPPREGLKKNLIGFLKDAQIAKLVYVSCDPATLARDLKALGSAYSIRKITPLDMFPQTKHIETVTVMEKRH